MSIINEALKKVQEIRKEPPAKDTTGPSAGIETKLHIPAIPADKKGIIKIAGIIVAVGIAAVILLKISSMLFSKKTVPAVPVSSSTRPSPKVTRVNPALATHETGNLNVVSSATSQEEVLPTLILNGIVYDEQQPYAIVNNKVLLKGEEIEGAKLVEINKDKIKFLFKDKEIELNAR